MISVPDAVAFAARAHANQTDKAGRPYIAHLLRVSDALAPYGPDAQMAGVLHDIIEDTGITAEDLLAAGFPPVVVEAVEACTRREGETYMNLIRRSAAHPLGRLVKLADNLDNSDEDRLKALDPAVAARLRAKYARAREILGTFPAAP